MAFRQMYVPLCGRFGSDEGGAAGCVDRSGIEYTAKWGVQMAKQAVRLVGIGTGQCAGSLQQGKKKHPAVHSEVHVPSFCKSRVLNR
ncbi:DUF6783 domain-containing protein [Diplocloster hominis]|uniref:DUF6783 domain-containing protein n=1 Tax=Diplocloster hominis TaxID=3079010 RepID=UPI003CCF023D